MAPAGPELMDGTIRSFRYLRKQIFNSENSVVLLGVFFFSPLLYSRVCV